MPAFTEATIVAKRMETADSIVLTLAVDEGLRERFRYVAGQHLPVRAEIDGKSVRRTYSICSSVDDELLRLGIRVQPGGAFSGYVANSLDVGDSLSVMPPTGHFNTPFAADQAKTYVAFVAGSGITPVLSIIKTALEAEPESRFMLFYGNRKRATTMFVEDLFALKNRYGERLALHFVMSQEPNEIALYEGRIDGARATKLHDAFLGDQRADEVFLCGPNPMIDDLAEALSALGYDPERVHSERYRAGLLGERAPRPPARELPKGGVEIGVLMDGQRQTFHMDAGDTSILDAARAAGVELPYSCKGGVCSTCRCRLVGGEVDMALNYALEPWELEKGFILTCQSTPKTSSVELDYDQT